MSNVSKVQRRKRVQLSFLKPSRTKQAFAAECDINNVVNRHKAAGIDLLDSKTALLREHFSNEVVNADNFDFKDALNRVALAHEAFAALPSGVRSQFKNDPALFVDFASDPKNEGRMVEWGLATPPPPAELKASETPSNAKPAKEPKGDEAFKG